MTMRLAAGLAIALWLALPATTTATAIQQDGANSSNAREQETSPPALKKTPADDSAPAPEKPQTDESVPADAPAPENTPGTEKPPADANTSAPGNTSTEKAPPAEKSVGEGAPAEQGAPAGQGGAANAPTVTPNSPSPAAETKTPEASQKAPAKKRPSSASANAAAKRRKRTVASSSATSPRTSQGTSRQTQSQTSASTRPSAPNKVVVREGGAKEPAAQIAPGMTPAEASRQRQKAEQWLGSTDGQLKQLAGRPLDERQQETVGQIHNYLTGARTALKDGDVGRASTLAQKAYLLSDDLVKH